MAKVCNNVSFLCCMLYLFHFVCYVMFIMYVCYAQGTAPSSLDSFTQLVINSSNFYARFLSFSREMFLFVFIVVQHSFSGFSFFALLFVQDFLQYFLKSLFVQCS
jgi:hypothetical protein